MIKLQNLTPSIYYQHSRDFQFIGRLYDIVLNSVKTNTNILYNLPFNTDTNTKVLDLLASTLGFQELHNYNIDQLKAVCSSFTEVLRNKGNVRSIQLACTLVLSAEGIEQEPEISWKDDDQGTFMLYIYISPKLSNLNLLRDILDYILPAGLSYNIIRRTNIDTPVTTNMTIANNVIVTKVPRTSISKVVDYTRLDLSQDPAMYDAASENKENKADYYYSDAHNPPTDEDYAEKQKGKTNRSTI